jgi:hypothetical protein
MTTEKEKGNGAEPPSNLAAYAKWVQALPISAADKRALGAIHIIYPCRTRACAPIAHPARGAA